MWGLIIISNHTPLFSTTFSQAELALLADDRDLLGWYTGIAMHFPRPAQAVFRFFGRIPCEIAYGYS